MCALRRATRGFKGLLAAAWLAAVSGGLCLAADGPNEKPLPPQDVTLKTSDGVSLVATYYPSRLGKNAVPVILLHAYKGNRADFEQLALRLQRAGHAVIAPDLRGHGESAAGTGEPRPADCAAMVTRDLEVVKRFLLARNNDGELNIERLGIVGVEMGATLAVNWAALDWSWPVLNIGKQGQDVKALVLVSPEWSFKGVKIGDALAQESVRSDLSVMIVVGKRSAKLLQEAKRLHTALERYHPAPPGGDADEKQTLWLKVKDTSLQGTKLLNEPSMRVDELILAFIDLRLVKPALAWSIRRSAHE